MSYLFKKALVRKPSKSIVNGISSSGEKPSFEQVKIEHKNYINILIDSKIELFTLNALEDYPDSMFVEDPAITYKDFCIILRPGAHSRFGEQTVFKNEAKDYFEEVFVIENGSIEGGDILNINENFIIGLSERTDIAGAEELAGLLKSIGAKVEITKTPKGVLHFKSDCSLLDNDTILQTEKMSSTKFFNKKFKTIIVPRGEEIAANSLRINENLLVPQGYRKTCELLAKNYNVKLVNVSEISKVDAGLSCMSLRW